MTAGATPNLVAALEGLGYAGDEGLVTGSTPQLPGPRDYVWRDLHTKVGLDAAFFRDGVPLVGFAAESDPRNLATLRRRLWNYGKVPLLLNVDPDGMTAYNAVTNPKIVGGAILAAERRSRTSRGLLEAFNRLQVTAGGFARQHARSYKRAARVDKALLFNLDYLRRSAAGNDPAHRSALDMVIGGVLLASYLADRGILNERHIDELAGATTLQDVLLGGTRSVKRFFEKLAEHFNGDVFGPLPSTLSRVQDQDLSELAALLRGDDLPSGQRALWPYDFSVLPADLVGCIYEQLLQEKRRVESTYYTPRFLVDILLDEVIPWDSGRRTLVDLACGSGAFMTEAFRRMAYLERSAFGRDLTYSELAHLLRNYVFGIEFNPDAARIAVFGLYLALLEELDPPTVWETAVLPKLLGTNVVVSDAFDDHVLSGKRFDAVVSNPPWRSCLTPAMRRLVNEMELPVSDQQQAQAFLWLGSKMLQPSGTIGLVMPARPLLHNRSTLAQSFRSALFMRLQVRAIVDLSAIRRDLFSSAVAPAALLVAGLRSESDIQENGFGEHEEIVHVAPHPRLLSSAADVLTITPEEVRTVSVRQAIGRPDIWKVMLWGGPRDLQLIDRLRATFPSVEEVASKLDWTTGRGYQVGGGDENDASHLRGLPDIPTEAIDQLRISQSVLPTFDREHLHRVRSMRLFTGPHVLIRRTVSGGRLAAVLLDEDAVFKDGVIGVAAPAGDRALLAVLTATIVSSLGQYYHFMTSSSWGVERDLVEANEHLTLPLATPSQEQRSAIETLLEAARTGLTSRLLRELDDAVFDVYGLTASERRRVYEGISAGIDRFRHPASYATPVRSIDLERYADCVGSALAATFPELAIRTRHFVHGGFRSVTITLREPNAPEDSPPASADVDIGAVLREAVPRVASSTGVVAQPAGFFVDEDTIYLIKTSDRDRWSEGAALDDADRILAGIAFGR
jgi:hypothetical protein